MAPITRMEASLSLLFFLLLTSTITALPSNLLLVGTNGQPAPLLRAAMEMMEDREVELQEEVEVVEIAAVLEQNQLAISGVDEKEDVVVEELVPKIQAINESLEEVENVDNKVVKEVEIEEKAIKEVKVDAIDIDLKLLNDAVLEKEMLQDSLEELTHKEVVQNLQAKKEMAKVLRKKLKAKKLAIEFMKRNIEKNKPIEEKKHQRLVLIEEVVQQKKVLKSCDDLKPTEDIEVTPKENLSREELAVRRRVALKRRKPTERPEAKKVNFRRRIRTRDFKQVHQADQTVQETVQQNIQLPASTRLLRARLGNKAERKEERLAKMSRRRIRNPLRNLQRRKKNIKSEDLVVQSVHEKPFVERRRRVRGRVPISRKSIRTTTKTTGRNETGPTTKITSDKSGAGSAGMVQKAEASLTAGVRAVVSEATNDAQQTDISPPREVVPDTADEIIEKEEVTEDEEVAQTTGRAETTSEATENTTKDDIENAIALTMEQIASTTLGKTTAKSLDVERPIVIQDMTLLEETTTKALEDKFTETLVTKGSKISEGDTDAIASASDTSMSAEGGARGAPDFQQIQEYRKQSREYRNQGGEYRDFREGENNREEYRGGREDNSDSREFSSTESSRTQHPTTVITSTVFLPHVVDHFML